MPVTLTIHSDSPGVTVAGQDVPSIVVESVSAPGPVGPQGPQGDPGSGGEVTAETVEAAGAVMESDTTTVNMAFVVDEDDMVSDSPTLVPTQQSVKKYVDSHIGASNAMIGTWRANLTVGGDPASGHMRWNNATQISATILTFDHVTADGYDLDNILGLIHIGDILLLQDHDNSENWQHWAVSGTPTGSHASTYWSFPVTFVDSNGTGTTNFPSNQRVFLHVHHETDFDQVVMDGDAAGGVLSGTYPDPGYAAGTQAFTDADSSKLDGIEASADVTDAANVAAAGAVMGSGGSGGDATGLWIGTESEYAAIVSPSATTVYVTISDP